MTGKELLKLAEEYPDFELEFVFTDGFSSFPNIRHFSQIEVADIGHSDKTIVLTGEER